MIQRSYSVMADSFPPILFIQLQDIDGLSFGTEIILDYKQRMDWNQFMGIDYQRKEDRKRDLMGIRNRGTESEVRTGGEEKGKIRRSGKSRVSKEIVSEKGEEMLAKAIRYRERYNQLNSQNVERNIQIPLQTIPQREQNNRTTVQNKIQIYDKRKQHKEKREQVLPAHPKPQVEEVYEKKRSLKSAQKGQQGKIVRNRLSKPTLKSIKEPRLVRSNTQPNELKMQISPIKDRKYVRNIFAEVVEEAKTKEQLRIAREKSKERKQQQLKALQEKEECLGGIVYSQTEKHLSAYRKRTGSYLEELKGEERVDQSIIHFLRLKVQRARTMMS